MKNYFLVTITFLLLTTTAFSRIFRVGYNGTPLKGVDYSSITEVNDSVAKAGDTIQIYGSASGSINKRLVILGFGYYLNSHPGLQSNPGISTNETDNPSYLYLDIKEGADSSIIEGCYVNGACQGYYVSANKVIFRRCLGGITLKNDLHSINDIKIYSCYSFSVFEGTNNNCYYGGVPSKFPCQNIQMFNCYNGQMRLLLNGSTGSIINCIDTYNNYNSSVTSDAKILVKNCIEYYYVIGGNTIWDNNIFNNGEPSPTLPGMNNKYAQVRDSIFVNSNGSSDENNFQLRANSPAKNFGIDLSGKPTDCGIFGGELAYRYKIGGQPAIPAFYKLSVPTNAASTNPYNITVSVRSNN